MQTTLQTDFLFPASSFLIGMGSAINVGGNYFEYNYSENPDALAIGVDWSIAGQDVATAMKASEGSLNGCNDGR